MLFSNLAGEAAATEEGMFLYQHSALSPHPGPPHSCFHVNPAPKWKVTSQHWNVNAFIKSDAESEGKLTTPSKGFSVLSPLLSSSEKSKITHTENSISLITIILQKGQTKIQGFLYKVILTSISFAIPYITLA